MHLAAQYLAVAGICFVDKKPDDSHTNMGFNSNTNCLESRILSPKGDQLLLSYQNFSLIWKSENGTSTFMLDGKSHKEALKWLEDIAEKALNKKYEYSIHYDIPYEIVDDFSFEITSKASLEALIRLRTLTQSSLEKVIESHGLEAEIRVWPHHFDTGIYTALPGTSISIGLGLAIPDTVCEDYYLYASGYNSDGQIDASNFEKLTKGYWGATGFKGAVLPATEIEESDGLKFFNQTIERFKHYK